MEKIGGIYFNTFKIPVGTKIKFAERKQKFTVRASNVAFAVCTKPFNPKHTVLYTVIDWNKGIRGTEGLVFPMGAETDQECQEMLARLTEGKSEVSYRNRTNLVIESIELPKGLIKKALKDK